MSEPEPNAIGTAELVVQQSDCASDLKLNNAPDENFPAVFATTRMIALMEMASARVLKPLLQSGEMSVGVTVDIIHSAATPIGAKGHCHGDLSRTRWKVICLRCDRA